jgi:hypothetical protein
VTASRRNPRPHVIDAASATGQTQTARGTDLRHIAHLAAQLRRPVMPRGARRTDLPRTARSTAPLATSDFCRCSCGAPLGCPSVRLAIPTRTWTSAFTRGSAGSPASTKTYATTRRSTVSAGTYTPALLCGIRTRSWSAGSAARKDRSTSSGVRGATCAAAGVITSQPPRNKCAATGCQAAGPSRGLGSSAKTTPIGPQRNGTRRRLTQAP